MEPEDLAPKKPKTHTLGEDLSRHSVGDLEELGRALGEELERVRTTLAAKRFSRDAAQSVFKI